MLIFSSSWNQSEAVESSVMKLAQRASQLIMLPDLQFSSKTMMSTTAKPLEITKSRLNKIARYLEYKRVLEYVYAYQTEVAECMAFGDSGREIARHGAEQRRCWRSWEITALRAASLPDSDRTQLG